jgi:acetoin utilization deacetylase AcuC-like enzyme
VEEAKRLCGGRVVFLLEGGYDLGAISEGTYNVVQALRGKKFKFPKTSRLKTIEGLKEILAETWKLR